MCTVSFIPRKDSFVFTSNRDEHESRPSAFLPKEKLINGKKIIFPQDPKAGGTWFAVNEAGMVAVLLNGAFKKHISKGGYVRSRGLVVLDIISNTDPHSYLNDLDLKGIEPFTIIVFQEGVLKEMRWDEAKKHIKILDIATSHIWSSATLYDEESIRHREQLFSSFKKKINIGTEDIINFHSNNNEDFENGFVIDRATGLKTFSVTQAILEKGSVSLKHMDLIKKKSDTVGMQTNLLMNHS